MRFGLEIFGTQPPGRRRGVGRYQRNLASALLARDDGHEFVLYAEEGPATADLSTTPGSSVRSVRPSPSLGAAVARLVRENPDALDILVFTNPLELTPGFDVPARPFGPRVPRLAAVVYDLIPLIFQDGYLRAWPGRSYAWRYLWALERLRSYDVLLTISEATRGDVLRLLNVPPERVVTIGAAGDDRASAFSPEDDPGDPDHLRSLGITRPFVFSTAASDPRKNLSGLLASLAMLPAVIHDTYQFVVATGLPGPELEPVRRQAEELGIPREALVLTGHVDEPALRALYRRCSAFVFPSLYEGFGLPLLEAMRSGAAVVAGDNSSQPEVAGDAALLVDTADPSALSRAVVRVLTDAKLAASLRARGRARADQFSWDVVAAKTGEALARLHKSSLTDFYKVRTPYATKASVRHRIAFVFPLPPHQSRVANYAEPLVDELGRRYAIDLFHDAYEYPPARFRSRECGVYDHRLFNRIAQWRSYSSIVYQMGNSLAHMFVYDMLMKCMGVVALHDLNLTSFHYERTMLGERGLDSFRRELTYCHPERFDEFELILSRWSTAPADMVAELADRGFDMLRRVVEQAEAVIVHSRRAVERLERIGPEIAAKTFVAPPAMEFAPHGSARDAILDDRSLSRAAAVYAEAIAFRGRATSGQPPYHGPHRKRSELDAKRGER